MMPVLRSFLPCTALTALLALGCNAAHATQSTTGCSWNTGPSGPLTYSADVGNFWVPRDAEVGSVIGTLAQRVVSREPLGRQVRCYNDGSLFLTVSISSALPVHPGTLPPINGWDVNGKVLQTSIPGVGLYIRMDHPFDGIGNNTFTPTDDLAIPYQGENSIRMRPSPLLINTLVAHYTLVKTGQIPAGPQSFSGLAATSVVTDVGAAFELSVRGGVQQAQCTLKADAVSADPVQLGDYTLADFSGVGSTTPDVDFHIKLSDCEDDPNASIARAHIRLEGRNGSVVEDPSLGLFSLSSGSTASGIAIQLLRNDGSPMELQNDVPVTALSIGTTQLDFRARYYQTAARVGAGSADGALDFTISYR
ncbi:hypothetical protein PS627_01236 [Pseudomonas fluorescens]|nr:hypothetical protein PS627_01236 [Pseudomonas fluorescens]